jgi:hypothetical protein
MITVERQEWQQVAEEASREQDPARLIELARRLAELLDQDELAEKPTSAA